MIIIRRRIALDSCKLLCSHSAPLLSSSSSSSHQASPPLLARAACAASASRRIFSSPGPDDHKPPSSSIWSDPSSENTTNPKSKKKFASYEEVAASVAKHGLNREDLKKLPFRLRRKLVAAMKPPKKKKKKPPPGPVQFEDLTAKVPAHSDLPFAFKYSYTEIPNSTPIRYQDEFSPFGPGRLDRYWDGQAALPYPPNAQSHTSSDGPGVSSQHAHFRPSNVDTDCVSPDQAKRKYPKPPVQGKIHRGPRSKEQIHGEPLSKDEIQQLVAHCLKSRKQMNLGRDGLTHNMLIDVHNYWRRERVIRIRCKGVPTLDMENVIFHLEDKTRGKVIERAGGTVYLFRGRNYDRQRDRPYIPPMLWKPHSPIYPRLIADNPGGLQPEELRVFIRRGRRMMPLCRLNKNGYYADLVRHVREAFLDDNLVRIDCKGMNPSDYRKIGAKLRDMVPCVLLSFEKEQILMWDGINMKKPAAYVSVGVESTSTDNAKEELHDCPYKDGNALADFSEAIDSKDHYTASTKYDKDEQDSHGLTELSECTHSSDKSASLGNDNDDQSSDIMADFSEWHDRPDKNESSTSDKSCNSVLNSLDSCILSVSDQETDNSPIDLDLLADTTEWSDMDETNSFSTCDFQDRSSMSQWSDTETSQTVGCPDDSSDYGWSSDDCESSDSDDDCWNTSIRQ